MVNEKRLYDLLIMVYRSPELMIKMTGVKQQHAKEPDDVDQVEGSERPQSPPPPELAIDGKPPAASNADQSKQKED